MLTINIEHEYHNFYVIIYSYKIGRGQFDEAVPSESGIGEEVEDEESKTDGKAAEED